MKERYITLRKIKDWFADSFALTKVEFVSDASFLEMVFPEALIGDPLLHKVWRKDQIDKDGKKIKNKRRSIIMNGKCGTWNGTQFREIVFLNTFLERVKQSQISTDSDFVLQTEDRCFSILFNTDSRWCSIMLDEESAKNIEKFLLYLVENELQECDKDENTALLLFFEDLRKEIKIDKARALSWMLYYAVAGNRIVEILPFNVAKRTHVIRLTNPTLEAKEAINAYEQKKAENILLSYHPQKIERALSIKFRELTKEYRRRPNPQMLYNVYFENMRFLHSSISDVNVQLRVFLDFLYSNHKYYYYSGLIYEFLGRTIINGALISQMEEARAFLQKAEIIFSNLVNFTEREVVRVVNIKWLIAVSYKVEKNNSYAQSVCRESLLYIDDNEKDFDVNYSDTQLLVRREMAILDNDESLFTYLIKDKRRIQNNDEEAFHTYRRLFEYYLANNNAIDARAIIPNLLEYYWRVRTRLPKIYNVDMLMYMFQYYNLVNDLERAFVAQKQANRQIQINSLSGKQKKMEFLSCKFSR